MSLTLRVLPVRMCSYMLASVIDAFMLLMKSAAAEVSAEVLILPSHLREFISMGLPVDNIPSLMSSVMGLVPIHLGRNHWVLFAVLRRKTMVLILEPLGRILSPEAPQERLQVCFYVMFN